VPLLHVLAAFYVPAGAAPGPLPKRAGFGAEGGLVNLIGPRTARAAYRAVAGGGHQLRWRSIDAQIIAPLEALKEVTSSALREVPDVAIETAALLETNTVAILEFLKQHEAAPVLGWRRMGEAAAAFTASIQLLSPSQLPPLAPLLKELRENFNSAVTRLAVPRYYLTREDDEDEADEERDDEALDVELLHEREEVPTITVSAIRPPGALRKNEQALDRMMHALRCRGVRSTVQATQLTKAILDRYVMVRVDGAHEHLPVWRVLSDLRFTARVFFVSGRARLHAEAARTLTSPDGFNQGFDPEIWSGQHVSSDAAQHLLQLVHFQDGLSLLEAELCEESLQAAHRAFSPDAPGFMGAGGIHYHPPGVGWTDEQSVVARASALLLLDSKASRTSLALAALIRAGGGGGTLEQRKALATDFESCGEQARLADAALAAAPPALELQANMEGTGGRVSHWARLLPFELPHLSRLGAIVRRVATEAWLKPQLINCVIGIAVVALDELCRHGIVPRRPLGCSPLVLALKSGQSIALLMPPRQGSLALVRAFGCSTRNGLPPQLEVRPAELHSAHVAAGVSAVVVALRRPDERAKSLLRLLASSQRPWQANLREVLGVPRDSPDAMAEALVLHQGMMRSHVMLAPHSLYVREATHVLPYQADSAGLVELLVALGVRGIPSGGIARRHSTPSSAQLGVQPEKLAAFVAAFWPHDEALVAAAEAEFSLAAGRSIEARAASAALAATAAAHAAHLSLRPPSHPRPLLHVALVPPPPLDLPSALLAPPRSKRALPSCSEDGEHEYNKEEDDTMDFASQQPRFLPRQPKQQPQQQQPQAHPHKHPQEHPQEHPQAHPKPPRLQQPQAHPMPTPTLHPNTTSTPSPPAPPPTLPPLPPPPPLRPPPARPPAPSPAPPTPSSTAFPRPPSTAQPTPPLPRQPPTSERPPLPALGAPALLGVPVEVAEEACVLAYKNALRARPSHVRQALDAAFTKLRSFPKMPQTKGAHVRILVAAGLGTKHHADDVPNAVLTGGGGDRKYFVPTWAAGNNGGGGA
jgi:hypothetical protein